MVVARALALLLLLYTVPAPAQVDPLANSGQVSVTDQDTPTLRQYLELQIATLRAWAEQRIASESEARALAATEVERRLVILNGHAENLREQQQNYLPRELFEAQSATVGTQLAELREWRANQEGRAATWGVLSIGVALLVSCLGLALSIWVNARRAAVRRPG